jgi:hypothetical protein
MQKLAVPAGLLWLLCSTPAIAAGEDGSLVGCDTAALQRGWSIVGGRRVFNEEDFRAIAIQLETPVYKAATGNSREPRSLRFSEHVIIVDPGENTPRIKVKDIGAQALGWVNRNELLCRVLPVNDRETGLYRRAVVRTATDVRGAVQEKEVYHSLDRRCEGGRTACVKVSRFQWYFVYAEIQDHYLISESASLGNSSQRLLGWLPVADALNWNTALGLRPSEQLAERRGPNNEPESYVCAYATVEELNSRSGCKEILGGMRWYNLDARMAVLKESSRERYYEVAFSNAFRNPDEQGRDPTTLVDPLKRLDVFFVIDGTKSMEPVIEGVKKIVGVFKERLRGKLSESLSQGGVLRFGFRIYRDSIRGGGDGVANSEHLALTNTCDKSNEPEFTRSFLAVKAFEPQGDDDYHENLFGALVQASADASACPDHTKVIFVIGDHGYDAAKQKARGFRDYTDAQVANLLKKGPRFNAQPIVVFIQTPSEETNPSVPAGSKARYKEAYDAFGKQAADILKGIYEGSPITTGAQHFIRLPPGSISDSVADRAANQVETYLRPDALALISERMRGGQSLVQIIDALRANSELNIPIRYLQFVESSLCDRLGARCRESVFETVNTAYVQRADDLVPEVMMSRDQLDKWLTILARFDAAMRRAISSSQTRGLIINALLQDIGDVLQIDVPNTPTEIGKLLQFQGGIPAAASSKLMQYTPIDLNRVPPCEIDYLVHYASRKHAILKIIVEGDGRQMPNYQEERWPDGQCPGLTDKGKNIPWIKSEVRPQRLNNPTAGTNYTFLRRRGQDTVYWIPVRFLP